jgi:tetratricopeptide (TPR) repeat protein
MRTTLLALVLAGVAGAAAPLAELTPEQLEQNRKALALFQRAQKEWKAGKRDQAVATMRQALSGFERLRGRDHLVSSNVSSWLAYWEEQRGNFAQSASHHERMWRIQEALRGKDDWRTVNAYWMAKTGRMQAGWTAAQNREWLQAWALNEEVFRLWQKGEPSKALPLAKKALSIRLSLVGKKHPDVALSLFNLAAQHEALGNHKQALPLYKRALSIRKEALGEKHPLYASSLNNLALLYKDMGDHKQALPLYKRALEIKKEVQGEKHPDYATGLHNLAALYKAMGDHKAALPLCKQALDIHKEALGEKHPSYAHSLHDLAALYQDMGDHKQALPLYKQALQIFKEVLGEKHPKYATNLNNLALLYQDMGDHKQALLLSKQALLIYKDALGEKHPDYATSLNNLALLYKDMGDHKQALPLYKQALQITKDALGEKHPSYARILSNLAELYRAMGDHKAGLPLSKQALLIRKEVLGEKHPKYATSLHTLALLYQDMGDYKAALPPARQALAIRKEVLGEKHPLYATSLDNLASLYREMGDHKQALLLSKQALQIKKEALGDKHPSYALSLNNLATLYQDRGEHKQALPLFQKALKIRKEALGEKHLSSANSLNSLATLYQKMGDHKAALPLYKQALQIRKEVQGEKYPDYALCLNNLAMLYKDMGDHKQALPLLKQALEIRKEALGEKHAHYATSLNNLASLYYDMGDRKQALLLSKKALQIRKEALGEKHPSYADSLNNLALLYNNMGEHKAALPLFKQALQITKEVLGEKHPLYATSLNNLASLYKEMGDHKAALPLCKQALAINKEVLGEKHPDYATSLNNLALLYKDMGDHKQALPLFQKALALRKEALGASHPEYARSLGNLAALYLAVGDHKLALPRAEEGITLALAHLRDSAAMQSDRQQLAATDKAGLWLHVRMSLLDTGCYGHLLTWKGAVLLRQRQRRLFTALSANPRTRQAANELQSVTRQIAALSASSRPIREQLEKLTKEQERLQAQLSEKAKAAFKEKPLTPQGLSLALPDGAILVDFHFYWRYGINYRDGKSNWVRLLVAFVSRRGKPTVRIDLGPAARVAEVANDWHASLASGKLGRPLGARLKKLVWSPLEKHLEGAKVVLISPDGPLSSVPFAALPGKESGSYLIEDVALAVVPVPQLLPEMLKPVDRVKRLKPSLLVVGDVDYDRAGAAVAGPDAEDRRGAPLGIRRDWAKLPATSGEMAAVSRSFSKLFKTGTVSDLDGASATKAKVREGLVKVRYAHLATHGFFAPENIKSAISGKKADAFFGRDGVTGWHPLLLSGIVLAGANKEPKAGEEDGILTALEVSEMELPKLELVVLSACETGLGQTAGGEGLLGLQRAFQVAGARTVVASLWEVPDQATQALMSEFYRVAWGPDTVVSRAEALRRAQLSVLKEGKRRGLAKKDKKLPKGETRLPPLYWAAFVLSGDWR